MFGFTRMFPRAFKRFSIFYKQYSRLLLSFVNIFIYSVNHWNFILMFFEYILGLSLENYLLLKLIFFQNNENLLVATFPNNYYTLRDYKSKSVEACWAKPIRPRKETIKYNWSSRRPRQCTILVYGSIPVLKPRSRGPRSKTTNISPLHRLMWTWLNISMYVMLRLVM